MPSSGYGTLSRTGAPTVYVSPSVESVKDSKHIYLTTRGRKTGKLHTVELWFAYGDGRLYLSHEGDPTDWMRNLTKEARVTAKIERLEFRALARVLEDGPSKQRGKKALYEKYYGKASDAVIDDWFELSNVVELIPE